MRKNLANFWNEVRNRVSAPPPTNYQPFVPDEDAPETKEEFDNSQPPNWESQSITGRVYLIVYSDSKGQHSERQIQCRRLAENGGTLYLHAFCYVREQHRSFRADRISAIVDTETGEVHEPGLSLLKQFDHTSSSAPFRYGLSPQQYADFNAALNVLVFMARCDGQWHPLEIEVIEEFAVSYWLRAEVVAPYDSEEVMRHAARLAPDAESFWVSLNRCAESPLLSGIIRRHIGNVIDADGMQHAHEIFWGREIDDFLAT